MNETKEVKHDKDFEFFTGLCVAVPAVCVIWAVGFGVVYLISKLF